MTFDISISRKPYTHKPTKQESAWIKFDRKNVTVDELHEFVTNGYAYCSVMKDNHHSDANFISTNTLTFDIDHTKEDFKECIERLKQKPSIAYTTSSNTETEHSYRLIYVLDSEVTTKQEYGELIVGLAETLELDKLDTHSYSCSQMWFGCCGCESFKSENVLQKNAIERGKYECKSNVGQKHQPNDNIKPIHYIEAGVFISDYWNLSLSSFVEKYITAYPSIESTPLEIDDEQPIITYPNDYFEIHRPWKMINGEVMKIKDGEGRRRKLFINGLIRKRINPSITFENLLVNIVYEFIYYYVNNGNRITKKELYDIAQQAFKRDITEDKLGRPRYKTFVNPLYCQKHNMSKQQVLAKSQSKQQYIGELYDPSLTDKENIAMMKEYGLDIHINTLQRWRKENNITKYKKNT